MEEAFSTFVNSAKSLERISKQARLFNRLLDTTPWVPKEEVFHHRMMRDLMASLSDLEETMEALQELANLSRALLQPFGSLHKEAKHLELDKQQRWAFIELADKIDGATRALDRISDEMQVLASAVEKAEPTQE